MTTTREEQGVALVNNRMVLPLDALRAGEHKHGLDIELKHLEIDP